MEKKLTEQDYMTKRLKQKASITLLFLLTAFSSSKAQEFQLAGVRYNNYTTSEVTTTTGNQETDFQEFGVFVNFPKQLKNEKTILINGIGYGYVEATITDFPSLQTEQYHKRLQEFYYHLTLRHKWNEKWSSMLVLKPTLASDFEEKLSSDDFVFQGAAIATRTFNERLKIGAGIANTNRFGTARIIPLVNLLYKNERHHVNALLPLNAIYTYTLLPKKTLKIGAKYELNGASFNISDIHLQDVDKINYSRANMGLITYYQLNKVLRLEAFGGLSTNRNYNFIDVSNNTLEFDSEPAPFFNIGLVLLSPKRK